MQEQRLRHARGAARIRAALLRELFRRAEPWLYRRYALLLAISEGDRRLLAEGRAGALPLLLPLAPAFGAAAEPAIPPGPTVLFVGAMSRNHNLTGVTWFLDEVWPRIAARVPEARFYVVGGGPPESLRARADGQRVFVTGFVDDLAPWYASAAVFVSPLLVAGGLLQKIVDAMAMGVPVVATANCNHGLAAAPGEEILIADAPEDFASSVVRLLGDAEERRALGRAGQRFIRTHYDEESALDRWEAAILAL